MKHLTFLLIPTCVALLFSSCGGTNTPAVATTSPLDSSDTEADRLLPKLLRGIPVGLFGTHGPNPVNAVFEDSMYIWKHNTTITSLVGDVHVVEYGSFVWTDAGWYHRVAMNAADFEQYYSCPGGRLKAGATYTDPTSWRRQGTLTGGDALWYYIVEDANGTRWKGTALVETEAVLEPATPDSGTVKFAPLRSLVQWTGYSEVGEYSLTGSIPVASGYIQLQNGRITAGEVVLNMTGLSHADKNLVEHLKGADFFAVDRHPEARFQLTSATPLAGDTCTAGGLLTLHGVTNEVSTVLRLTQQGGTHVLSAKIKMDRTAFGVRYGSADFFSNLGDQAIKNEMLVEVHLVGERK